MSQVPCLANEVMPFESAECLCVCVIQGDVLEGKARCERMMHLIHCEERRKMRGKEVEGKDVQGDGGDQTELLAPGMPPTGPRFCPMMSQEVHTGK